MDRKKEWDIIGNKLRYVSRDTKTTLNLDEMERWGVVAYLKKGCTQSVIAEHMHISIRRVRKLIAEAEIRGEL